MTWYVASIIMSIKYKNNNQSEIPVYENFFLVSGQTSDVALAKAIEIGKREEMANDDITLDNKPAKMIFEGIRKLINISNPEPIDLDGDPPVDETELTYSQYIVESQEKIKELVDGGEVVLRYVE